LPSEPMGLSTGLQSALRCPVCQSSLESAAGRLRCLGDHCTATFPVVGGIPILLNEERSIFSIESLANQARSRGPDASPPAFSPRDVLKRLIPGLSLNVAGRDNFRTYTDLLLKSAASPRVLVVGGKNEGEGFDVLLSSAPPIELAETDVVFGPRTMLICDSHDLPFQSGYFDGVVVQAVLEHVVDPFRCVEEIYRVLRPDGLVYAETPFIQQVHEGRFDFTRFTHLGHRRLFRRFNEISSGAVCGTGMALAWTYRYFLLSLSDSPLLRNLLDTFARFTAFPLKWFDRYTSGRAGVFDAASAYYFLGTKSDSVLSDRELIKLYRGRI
jgi:SAM-dependent methyltransferase